MLLSYKIVLSDNCSLIAVHAVRQLLQLIAENEKFSPFHQHSNQFFPSEQQLESSVGAWGDGSKVGENELCVFLKVLAFYECLWLSLTLFDESCCNFITSFLSSHFFQPVMSGLYTLFIVTTMLPQGSSHQSYMSFEAPDSINFATGPSFLSSKAVRDVPNFNFDQTVCSMIGLECGPDHLSLGQQLKKIIQSCSLVEYCNTLFTCFTCFISKPLN